MTTVLAWSWVAIAMAAYLWQFRDMTTPVLRMIGLA